RRIAKKLGRSVSTISEELKRNGGTDGYDPHAAHLQSTLRRWEANSRNPLKAKEFDALITRKLKEGWSPEIIAGWVRTVFRDDPSMQAVHETIYRRIYQLRLTHLLPRGLPRRQRRRYRLKKAAGIQGLGAVTGIEKRPKTAQDRSRFGHWEGDTMLGRKTAGPVLAVQQDRKSRYLLLTKMRRKTAGAMKRAVIRQMQQFPPALRRSLTLDRGTENAAWQSFGLPVYFCDPYASWQKGSVEQVIGLFRRYIPKGTDLRTVTPVQLKAIQDRLNHRPRKVLGFKTPHDVFSAHCKRLSVRI
ncbi:MAG: IS30 family transposase, partial [Nitrospira sp.]|nr:IS30 family transposase [Nitrospira sp.]